MTLRSAAKQCNEPDRISMFSARWLTDRSLGDSRNTILASSP